MAAELIPPRSNHLHPHHRCSNNAIGSAGIGSSEGRNLAVGFGSIHRRVDTHGNISGMVWASLALHECLIPTTLNNN